jgi:uncharacterized protein
VRTIALEEHFWTAELAPPPGTGPLAVWGQRIGDQLRDLGSARLADMDASGVDFQVISHVAPALLDTLPLSPADVAKIAGGNAERVLRIKPAE